MNDDTVQKWYFTFGQQHFNGDNDISPLRDRFVVIEGTFSSARERLMKARGPVFASQYNEKEFLPQIKQFNLAEIALEDLRPDPTRSS